MDDNTMLIVLVGMAVWFLDRWTGRAHGAWQRRRSEEEE